MGTAVHAGTVAAADALTAEGQIVRIRPVTAADAAGLEALYHGGSVDSLRMRFFVVPGDATLKAEIDRLCRPPSGTHGSLVALSDGAIVGVASWERGDPDTDTADFAVFVGERSQGEGIGTLLLEHLCAWARTCGVTRLVGQTLAGNVAMRRVTRGLDSDAEIGTVDEVVELSVPTTPGEASLLAMDVRDRSTQRASLGPLLAPRAVAVVGAGRRPGGVGHETLAALRDGGYTGDLYAVNPHAAKVAGVEAYRCLSDLPGPVDLVVVAVPADAVAAVVEQAADAGAGAVVVLSSGFGETGPAGQAMQSDLVRVARKHGIRLVGPNCLGVVNTDPEVALNASFAAVTPARGGLAVASQSGAVGIALLEHAARNGCGVSTFVSLGNKADVSGNDLIAYWYDDPATTAVALYLESFGNPRRFARTVRALARRKPVLAVKSGRSQSGRRAGASHTAAAASPDVSVDALFAQAGVIRVDHLGELIDAARMLTDQPLPGGDRLAIIGNAGGINVLAADAAESGQLTVPTLTPHVTAQLAACSPGATGHDNPLDLGAAADTATFAAAVEAVAGSGEVDALLLVVAATRANDVPGTLAALAAVLDRHHGLPAAVVVLGMSAPPTTLGARHAPVFDLPEQAVTALGHAARYAAWRREPLGHQPALAGVDPRAARKLVESALHTGDGWQAYDVIAAVLACYGIGLLTTAVALDADAAVSAARAAGYPVALKSADPRLVHKSDVGGVRLHLRDDAQVRKAFAPVASAGDPSCGVLVQPMAPGDVELTAGIVHDPLFGSLVMFGHGGVHTDVLADRSFRLVPLTDRDTARMWQGLRSAPLLTGYRGAPPVDTGSVEDLIARIGRLAQDLPEIAELDLNPVLAGPDGVLAVDAKMRLATVGAEPDPSLRQLRSPD
ncbi:GNAT family N-acetyltransferase [Catellatospora sp. NPDC049111]|uniref:bifunctional acetate--CoA ligase family protein/GNAT family N-acetyltransferase n=1 Tax=Catellatospora sp. NPDC049111 TaxID=3155271 RepID=UPI003408999E